MRLTRRRGPIVSCARRGRSPDSPGQQNIRAADPMNLPQVSCDQRLTKTLVDSSLSCYLLQHLLAQGITQPCRNRIHR